MKMSFTPRLRNSVSTLQPELGALVGARPQPQNILVAFQIDAYGHVHGAVLHPPFVPHLDHQRIQKQDRIQRLQRAALPLLQFLDHRIGDCGNQRRRHFRAIDLLQMALDLACRHAPRVQRQDLGVETREAALVRSHDLGRERAITVARHFDLRFPEIALQLLTAGTVA
jgi:hypothetical protein